MNTLKLLSYKYYALQVLKTSTDTVERIIAMQLLQQANTRLQGSK